MREADNLTTFMCRMSWKYGSLNLLEPSGPVMGLLYHKRTHIDTIETFYMCKEAQDQQLNSNNTLEPNASFTNAVEQDL